MWTMLGSWTMSVTQQAEASCVSQKCTPAKISLQKISKTNQPYGHVENFKNFSRGCSSVSIHLKCKLTIPTLGECNSYFYLFEMKGCDSCDRNSTKKAKNNCKMNFVCDRFLCIEHAFQAFSWHLAFSCIFRLFFSWHCPVQHNSVTNTGRL